MADLYVRPRVFRCPRTRLWYVATDGRRHACANDWHWWDTEHVDWSEALYLANQVAAARRRVLDLVERRPT